MALLSNLKLYAIGALLTVAFFGAVMWRAYAKGEAAARADAAIAGLNKALAANAARRNEEVHPTPSDTDPYNRL